MSVINTPLLKEEVGHRKFFDPERQANDAARNDAQVFNNILNDKVKEGVSNIRRNRYLTYSVTADTAEDAARQLSRIEVESSRILNSIGSKAHLMNGTQRLSVIHSLLNPYKPFSAIFPPSAYRLPRTASHRRRLISARTATITTA